MARGNAPRGSAATAAPPYRQATDALGRRRSLHSLRVLLPRRTVTSFRRYASNLGHPVPTRFVVSNEFRELFRSHRRRHAAVFGEARDDLGIGNGAPEGV